MSDPLGWKHLPFDATRLLGGGLRLAAKELPAVLLVGFLFAIPVATLELFISGDGADAALQSSLAASVFNAVFGIIGIQALLARFIARAEGRSLSLSAAFSESLGNWVRCFGARFHAGLIIGVLALLLVVPGIWKATQLVFVPTAALRSRRDPLDVSQALVRGRWWPVFGFMMLSSVVLYGPTLVVVGVVSLGGEMLQLPRFLTRFLSEWLFSLARGGDVAVMLAAFYAMHTSAGIELEPMRWSKEPPLAEEAALTGPSSFAPPAES